MTEEQLTALLRLKRYEQPPPEYFDGLLRDLHRRQRSDLLRRPLWKIAAERMQTFFSEHSMGHVSYAGALAVALVGGITVIGLMTPSHSLKNSGEALASAEAPYPRDTRPEVSPQMSPQVSPQDTHSGDIVLHLQNASLPKLVARPVPAPEASLQSSAREPRYVIDARPASYEPSSSFNF